MILKDKLLEIAKNDDEKILISRIIDLHRQAQKNFEVETTQFLNGHELSLVQRVLGEMGVCFSAFGGCEECERNVVCVFPSNPYDFNFPIDVIKIFGRDLQSLSHRDYLGAILALGIKRNKIGDVLIGEDCAYLFCLNDISNYIINQLEKIGSKSVKLQIWSSDKLPSIQKKFKEISTTVSSMRLDAVISAGYNISRGEAVSLIKAGKVTANWQVMQSPSFEASQNQIISAQGFGRIEVFSIRGETKKGRIALTIRKYI